MRRNKRETNRIVIQKIIAYCNDIEDFRSRVNASYEIYLSNKMFRMAVDFSVYQIGELTTRFSEDFKAQHSEIPWHEIKGLRNIHAHDYERVNTEIIGVIKNQLN